MQVYFIRHGETYDNKAHRHQPNDAVLSEHGKEQARVAEPIIREMDPTHFVTSTFTRAAQTAEILNENLALAIERNELFVELVRPDAIIGLHHFGPRSLWYMVRWFFSKNESYWERVHGESRTQFLARIEKAKDYLETLPSDARIVVVSHSIFINFFLEHICSERPIGIFKAARLLLKIKQLDNSSISHVSYTKDAPVGACPWTLVSFDDDGHVKSE